MKKYDIFLLDADQTVLDFDRAESYALERAFLHFELPFSAQTVKLYHAINLAQWKSYERGEIARGDIFINRFKLLFEKLHLKEPAGINDVFLGKLKEAGFVLDGALQFTAFIKSLGRVYIATNGVGEVQRSRIALSGLTEYTDGIFISDEIGFGKPSREFFIHIEKNIYGFDKRRTLMIGDSLTSDIAGASGYGIDTLWLNRERQKPPEVKPTYTAYSFDDVKNILLSV